eukprot:TRINITY_DN776120_c0_g1_i1.p1 TRINITY_DN776120_c0_g1~~TRINITY_DN776120_c0_g1_i1.p1  ORF type:complete len:505 (+),score=101.08 TRINITY_DN776120_c0_g1_i1:173-1687(+)
MSVFFRYVVLIFFLVTFTQATYQQHTVVLDAGSSGTRLHVYSYDKSKKLPKIDEIAVGKLTHKTKPGLASFVGDREGAVNAVEPLFKSAMSMIPGSHHASTPFYIRGTAGFRLVQADKVELLFKNLVEDMAKIQPFQFDIDKCKVLSGEEEGIYGWIALNYLRSSFGSDGNLINAEQTVGSLDLGGASTQIAFIPKSHEILADFFPLVINSHIYPAYTHSYLRYGQEEIENRFHRFLLTNHKKNNQESSLVAGNPEHYPEVVDPCMLEGDSVVSMFGSLNYTFVGKPDQKKCESLVEHLLNVDIECLAEPCAVHGEYQPLIPADMDFVAMSAFFYTIQGIGLCGEHENSWNGKLIEVLHASRDYCALTIADARHMKPNESDRYLRYYCLIGVYSYKLLSKGYGIADDSKQVTFQWKDKSGVDVSWTLGSMLYDASLIPLFQDVEPEVVHDHADWKMTVGTSIATLVFGIILGTFFVKKQLLGKSDHGETSNFKALLIDPDSQII